MADPIYCLLHRLYHTISFMAEAGATLYVSSSWETETRVLYCLVLITIITAMSRVLNIHMTLRIAITPKAITI